MRLNSPRGMNVHDFIKLQCQCEVVRLCGYNLYFENIFVHLSFIQVSIFELVE